MIPTATGFYWATLSKNNHRTVVELRYNGFKQLRVYAPWYSRSFGLEEFTEWSKKLIDPRKSK